MIEKDKKYRLRAGYEYVLLDIVGDWAFGRYKMPEADHWIASQNHVEDGKEFTSAYKNKYDLIEILPYEDFKVDDKVLVWNKEGHTTPKKAYFSRVAPTTGKAIVFCGGQTSWMNTLGECSYDFCEKWVDNE